MKKLMLNAIALLFIGVLAAQAQSTPADSQLPAPSVQQQQPRSSEWSKVETDKIPAPVLQTLRSDKYKGWESSGLYFNKSTNQYSVDISTGATPELYYFDQKGRTVTAAGASPQKGTTGSAARPTPNAPRNSGSTPPPPNNQ